MFVKFFTGGVTGLYKINEKKILNALSLRAKLGQRNDQDTGTCKPCPVSKPGRMATLLWYDVPTLQSWMSTKNDRNFSLKSFYFRVLSCKAFKHRYLGTGGTYLLCLLSRY